MREKLRLAALATFLTLAWALPASAASPNSLLKGTYSFQFYGQDDVNFPLNTANAISGVGVFTANGRGSITGGSLSYNDRGFLCSGSVTGGSYGIQSDGEGTLTLTVPSPAGVCFFTGNFTFNIAVGDFDKTGAGKKAAGVVQLSTSTFTKAGVAVPQVPVSGTAYLQ